METVRIWIQGIVQGVGFRPNVYRIAKKLEIKGYVRNFGNLVEIIAQGENMREFIRFLCDEKPPVSKINSIEHEKIVCDKTFTDFKIFKSSLSSSGSSVVPPDLAVCKNCLKELRDKNNRRYRFPFVACTNCGPRFSVIKSIPYDRDRTTMDDFPLCEECLMEYEDPLDRRYHAEASCCDKCGPILTLYNREHEHINGDSVKRTVELLDDGNIIAMKGIGGTHLVCSVNDDDVILKLRKRLNRPNQPFAIMSPDIETIKTFAELGELEEKSLKSIESPIVVVRKNKNYSFPDSLAPILHNIGVILPYSPIHYLLFDYTNEPAYVMTSANIPGEPMVINNEDILNELNGIADYFLIHNRKIANRCDDSVIRYVDGKLSFIRRSRGYAPTPYNLKKYSNDLNDLNVLALGSELDVTFTILKDGLGFVSQHIGNTNKFKTYQFLQDGIDHLARITSTKNFDLVAIDMHPQFHTSSLGMEISKEYGSELVKIQHHHAHGAVLAFDNNVDELVFIGADGVGYGDDKTAWGGEILYSDIGSYKRLASLSPQKIPGGDTSTKYPARFLLSLLYNVYDEDELRKLFINNYIDFFKYKEKEIDMVFKQLEKNFNVPITTSTGRVLDSIAVALGICGKRTYEGEASMKLESIASKSTSKMKIEVEFSKYENRPVLDTSSILKQVIEMRNKGIAIKDIAKTGQESIAIGLGKMAVDGAIMKNVDVIGATGGVFYNEAISNYVKKYVEKQGFKFIRNNNSCAGDGSVSLGQAIISSYRKS
ncbi:MAG: carbamoyltransferase HypF [Methanobrevibacter sp.]|jgi:hydrogenase maturation protein HypF|nr:carbamoyltransferase HypF [Candidatus Methanovirga basalitermitum]